MVQLRGRKEKLRNGPVGLELHALFTSTPSGSRASLACVASLSRAALALSCELLQSNRSDETHHRSQVQASCFFLPKKLLVCGVQRLPVWLRHTHTHTLLATDFSVLPTPACGNMFGCAPTVPSVKPPHGKHSILSLVRSGLGRRGGEQEGRLQFNCPIMHLVLFWRWSQRKCSSSSSSVFVKSPPICFDTFFFFKDTF